MSDLSSNNYGTISNLHILLHIQHTMFHSTIICEYISYYSANENFTLEYPYNTIIFMFNAAIGSRIVC